MQIDLANLYPTQRRMVNWYQTLHTDAFPWLAGRVLREII